MTNKSLNFIQERIPEGGMYDLVAKDFADAYELNLKEALKLVKEETGELLIKDGDIFAFNIERPTNVALKYDPNARFEYFSISSPLANGESTSLAQQIDDLLHKLLRRGTFPPISVPSGFRQNREKYDVVFTAGNFVVGEQIIRNSIDGTLPSRIETKVALPLKCEFILKEDIKLCLTNH